MAKTDVDKLLVKHPDLFHSDNKKVLSHVQREVGDWIQNTLMIEGADTPFVYRRKKCYRSLQGARVNLTYYPDNYEVAGLMMDRMTVVRIRVS